MERKKKIGLILFALLAFVIVATASSIVVSTVSEGKALLGTSNSTNLVGCKVYSIQKVAESQDDFDNDWTVKFALEYEYESDDGRMVHTREGVRTVFVKNDSETDVKNAVEPICDQDWVSAQERYGVIKQVIVEAKTNPVLSKTYNPISQTWNSLTAQLG